MNFMSENWVVARLGDIAKIKYGKCNPHSSGNIPLVGSSGIYGWVDKPLVDKPTLIIGRKGTAGKVQLFNTPCYPSDTTFYLDFFQNNCDLKYLFYYISLNRLSGEHSKTTVPSIQKNDLENYLLYIPPLSEQQQISYVLSTVQEARDKTQAVIEAARELKKSLRKHLFTYGPVPVAEAGDVQLKETEIGNLSDSFEIIKLGEVCRSSAFGPRFSSNYYDTKGNVAVLRTTDLDNDGKINYNTMPLARLDLEKFKRHLLNPNDLLITRSGTCGIAAIFSENPLPVLPGAFLIRFRLSERINPFFLQQYINSTIGQDRISKIAMGAVQKNISGKSLLDFKIPLPTSGDQRRIMQILEAIDCKIAAEIRHKAAIDSVFKTLLDSLMTGKIRVNHMDVPQ